LESPEKVIVFQFSSHNKLGKKYGWESYRCGGPGVGGWKKKELIPYEKE
jgi:hypothetical protein